MMASALAACGRHFVTIKILRIAKRIFSVFIGSLSVRSGSLYPSESTTVAPVMFSFVLWVCIYTAEPSNVTAFVDKRARGCLDWCSPPSRAGSGSIYVH